MITIVMGVSGSGKSTIGEDLAVRLGQPFVDGDHLHPPANRDKMAHGVPLDDADRQPWLEAIVAEMDRHRERGQDDVKFIFLHGSKALLAERLRLRAGHFFDPRLLDSQLSTLEEPTDDEAMRVEVGKTPAELVECIIRADCPGPHM